MSIARRPAAISSRASIGAHERGVSLVFSGALMALAALMGTSAFASDGGDPTLIAVPSGQPIVFHEAFLDDVPMGLTARYRFVAEELPKRVESLSYADLEADLAKLCTDVAVPGLEGIDPAPERVVISLSATQTEFGAVTPDVVQVFEAYRFEAGACTWEAF